MAMVSYWTKVDNIFESDSFVVILGNYNHKNAEPNGGKMCLGLYWQSEDGGIGFPNSRGYLAPIVLEDRFNEGFLQFILLQSIKDKNIESIDKIKNAINELIKV